MMFSATFQKGVQELAADFLYDHIWVGVGRIGGAVETVTQKVEMVEKERKPDRLMEVLNDFLNDRGEDKSAIVLVFCNSKNTCKWLDEQLWEQKFDMCALHGDLDQWKREESINKFKRRECDIMVATDVASRGLDIEKVNLVINYD